MVKYFCALLFARLYDHFAEVHLELFKFRPSRREHQSLKVVQSDQFHAKHRTIFGESTNSARNIFLKNLTFARSEARGKL